MQLGAGGGVGVGPEQVDRGLEVLHGRAQLHVATVREPGGAVQRREVGRIGERRRDDRGFVLTGRLVPGGHRHRLVTRPARDLGHDRRIGTVPRLDEVVRDRTGSHGLAGVAPIGEQLRDPSVELAAAPGPASPR